jgi:hypothetical protein
MIDFRYHIVSIVAVFFALAVGIVLGAGPLDDDVNDVVAGQVGELRVENQNLRTELGEQGSLLEYSESFAAGVGPAVTAGRLDGRRVLLVQLPGSSQDILEGTEQAVTEAGGRVLATLQVRATWNQPETDAVLDTLAAQLLAPGSSLDADADGYARGASVLAEALMARGQASQRDAVIDAYTEAGLISLSSPLSTHAELALAVAPPAPEEGATDEAADETTAELALLVALDEAGQGSVLGGSLRAAAEGGLVWALRESGDVRQRVSSVDVLDTASGQVTAVLALREQVEGGVGQYGAAEDADAAVPTLGPTDSE